MTKTETAALILMGSPALIFVAYVGGGILWEVLSLIFA